MKRILDFILAFLLIGAVVALLSHYSVVEFGQENYWDHHGLFFLIFISFFPRLTLLFSSVPSGGLIWWLGWIFAPRVLVAILATLSYWNKNPILVVVAWLVAIGGESTEKVIVIRHRRRNSQALQSDREIIDVTPR